MNKAGFKSLLEQVAYQTYSFAARHLGTPVVVSFGKPAESSARCGCHVFLPDGEVIDLYICEDETGQIFSSDDDREAKPFCLPAPSSSEREQIEQFRQEVETEIEGMQE